MKKNLLLLLIVITCLKLSAQIPNDDVASYYFNSGSLSNNVSPGTGDLTGSGVNFTFTSDRFGIANNALRINQDVLDGHTFTASSGAPVNAMTVSLWHLFNGTVAASPANNETIYEAFDASSNGLRVYKAAAGWGIEMKHNGTTYNTSIQSSTHPEIIDATTWHNIIITVNATGGSFFIDAFLDGVQIGTSGTTTFISPVNWITSNATFKLSPRYPGSNTSLRSDIDDIRLYRNKAVTPAEAIALFNQPSPNQFQRIYVDNQNGNDSNSGDSWVNAVKSLNLGISRTSANGELWIAGGTYTPDASNRDLSFNFGRGIQAFGGFNGTEVNLSDRIIGATPTILSGDLLGNDSGSVSTTNSTYGENSTTVVNIIGDTTLDGITISGGFASGSSSDPSKDKSGGGIYISEIINADLNLNNCILENNIARNTGAAFYTSSGNALRRDIRISGCIFRNNLAREGAGIYQIVGSNTRVDIEVVSSLFYDNVTNFLGNTGNSSTGSSAYFLSGSSNNSSVNVYFVNNTIIDNLENVNVPAAATISIANFSNMTFDYKNNLTFNNDNLTINSPSPIYVVPFTGNSNSAIVFDLDDNMNANAWSGIPSSAISNTITQTPTFTDYPNDVFRLTQNSRGVDEGNNSNVSSVPNGIAQDLDGQLRIENTIVDIGAYEVGTTSLSIDDFNDTSTLSIFPNPVNNILNIESREQINAVEIYAISGRKVLQSNQNRINVSKLNAGIYIIKVDNKVTRFIKK